MSKKCGKCSKTVYPTEELKCLDKVWHKACFKCQVCSMTLNMKNYKGYDKLPYCNAHYPQTKHTAVADTPESRRIAENTKIQSNIKYHENFEKEKGKKMSVADDPETQRLKKNMQVVSNVAYHNTLQEKARMEQNRPNEETDNFAARRRGNKNPGSISDYVPTAVASPPPPQNQPTHVYNSKGEEAEVFDEEKQNHQPRRQIGSIADYDPIPNQIIAGQPSGYQSVPSQQPRSPAMFAPTPYSPPVVEDKPDVKDEEPVPQPYSDQTEEGPPEVVGGGFKTTYPTVIPSSPTGSPADTRFSSQSISPTPQSHEEDVSGGTFHTTYSVDTPDLVEDDNVSRGFSPSVDVSHPPVEEPSAVGAGFRTTYQVDEEAPQPPKQNKGVISQALYDYAAADTDEVSFMENDIIINCDPVDDGWMYGTVERTNKRGMLPSNYVQRIN